MLKRSMQDKNRKTTSLRSLTKEITGVRSWTSNDIKNCKDVSRMERDFNAAYQELKRIQATLASYANIKGPVKINEKNAKSVTAVMKKMYHGGELRTQYEQMHTNKPLPEKEQLQLLYSINAALIEYQNELLAHHLHYLKAQMKAIEYQNLLADQLSSLADNFNKIIQTPDIALRTKKLAEFQLTFFHAMSSTREHFAILDLENLQLQVNFSTGVEPLQKVLRILWGLQETEGNSDE